MTKIKSIIAFIVFLFIFSCVLSVCIPSLGEVFNWLIEQIFLVIKNFFLRDIGKEIIIYLVIAIFTTGSIIVSKKTEKKIWIWVAIIIDTLGLIAQIQNYN